MPEPPVIDMRGISRVYRGEGVLVEALSDIDLRVDPGDFVAVMGPSGSGKSTLMHIIGCLDRPTSGTYHLMGEEVARLNGDALAHARLLSVGFVFQTFNLLPRLTALQNVELPMIYAGAKSRQRRERATTLLRAVGLENRTGHRPNQLSGGERQRVAIARALANDPKIILADEPTGNLDSRAGAEIVSLLEGLHSRGRTIILITHEAQVAEHARRVLTLSDGRIVGATGIVGAKGAEEATR